MVRRWRWRLAGALCLLGIALLIIGLFPPWIIRIDYLPGAGCPYGPNCPPPTTDSRSLWDFLASALTPFSPSALLPVALWLGPLALVILLQFTIAIAGLRERGRRVLFALGLASALLVLALYLLTARVYYCLFFMGCGGVGLWVTSGERIFASGFWLLLGGFLVSIASDLALLLRGGGHSRSA